MLNIKVKSMLLETAIYESPMGYVPHIKWNSKLINEFGGNQMKGLNDKIRNIFPDVIDKLNKAGIVSKGREMYAKGIINRTFTSLEEAKQAESIYSSIIKSL